MHSTKSEVVFGVAASVGPKIGPDGPSFLLFVKERKGIQLLTRECHALAARRDTAAIAHLVPVVHHTVIHAFARAAEV